MGNKAAGHKPETCGIIVAGVSCWTSTFDVRRQQEAFSSNWPVGSTKSLSSSRVGCDLEPTAGTVEFFFLLSKGLKVSVFS